MCFSLRFFPRGGTKAMGHWRSEDVPRPSAGESCWEKIKLYQGKTNKLRLGGSQQNAIRFKKRLLLAERCVVLDLFCLAGLSLGSKKAAWNNGSMLWFCVFVVRGVGKNLRVLWGEKKLLKTPQETKSSGIPNMSTLCLRCSPDKAGGFRFTTITLSKRVFFLARCSEAWKLPMSIASAGQNLEIHFFPQDWEEGIIHIPKQKKES